MNLPTVLCMSGHDPSGGAGLQADIETVSACGGYANTLVTCLTVQNHRQVESTEPVDSALLFNALNSLYQHSLPSSIKIGLLGNAEQAVMLADWIRGLPEKVPVVLDPVVRASDGSDICAAAVIDAIREHLLPVTTVLTPNHYEALQLSDAGELATATRNLIETGCQHVLLTGGDQDGNTVVNELYGDTGLIRTWSFPRLAASFHGSGCTLAAALATYIAAGADMQQACDLAQSFTQLALEEAHFMDSGPGLPRRNLS